MEFLVAMAALVIFDIVAWRWGVDSRDDIGQPAGMAGVLGGARAE